MSQMTTAEYNKMCKEGEEAAEAFARDMKKEYPNMPKDVEEACYLCQQMGKGCDCLPCDKCYESWR